MEAEKSNAKSQQDPRVIILEGDGKISATHGYGYPIRSRFIENGIQVQIVPLPENASSLQELPKAPIVISGGMTEVTAHVEWIIQAKNFISDLIESNQNSLPRNRIGILGICFGAQLIAEAYQPGSVEYLDEPEIGTSQITLKRPSHPLFEEFSAKFEAYSFHYNQIRPIGFSILSEHHYKKHHFLQAFEIPDAAAYGVQFHPEFRHDSMKELLATYKDLVMELGIDVEPIMREIPEIDGNERLLLNFVNMHT